MRVICYMKSCEFDLYFIKRNGSKVLHSESNVIIDRFDNLKQSKSKRFFFISVNKMGTELQL